MNKLNNSNNFSDNEEKNNTNFPRPREKETDMQVDSINNEFQENAKNFNDDTNCVSTKISMDQCYILFDNSNINFLKNNTLEKKIINDINLNMKKTPNDQQDKYSNKVIQLISSMKKSDIFIELPLLPYGKHLTDSEFIDLLKKCISYANYNFEEKEIKNIRDRLINNYLPTLKDLFKRGQVIKDLLQNALLTILISKLKNEQEDNFNLLQTMHSTATPIINMEFNNDEKYKLNSKEFIDIFCSNIYIRNFKKALKKFIDNVPSVEKLKQYIKAYFNNYYIYFSELPSNIYGLTVHTGNIYIQNSYLYEYYNEKASNSQIIIREKIILNVAHELTDALVREISNNMKNNFFIKSNNNKKTKSKELKFKDKFTEKFHYLYKNESGNEFDYNFFNNYYFDNLYLEEAKLFANIKTIKSIKEYKKKLEEVIKEEKTQGFISEQVNKFKKLNNDSKSRCFRSQIFGEKKVTKEEYNKKFSDSDESDNDEIC